MTSIWRRALRLSYPVWHVLHSALGVLIVLAALGHAFLVHYYLSEPWVRLAWTVYGVAFLWLAVWVRLVKPLRLWRRPWRVVELWPEPGQSVTVGLEPASPPRRTGVHLRGRPVRLDPAGPQPVHGRPFTRSPCPRAPSGPAWSSPSSRSVSFTNSMRRLKVGDTVYVDGPHGSFTLERNPGIGIRLRGGRRRGHPVPHHAVDAGRPGDRRPSGCSWPTATRTRSPACVSSRGCKGRLNLTVVHVDQPAHGAVDGRARAGSTPRPAGPAPPRGAPLAAVLRLRPRGDGDVGRRARCGDWASRATASTANSSGWCDVRFSRSSSAAWLTSLVLLLACILWTLVQR